MLCSIFANFWNQSFYYLTFSTILRVKAHQNHNRYHVNPKAVNSKVLWISDWSVVWNLVHLFSKFQHSWKSSMGLTLTSHMPSIGEKLSVSFVTRSWLIVTWGNSLLRFPIRSSLILSQFRTLSLAIDFNSTILQSKGFVYLIIEQKSMFNSSKVSSKFSLIMSKDSLVIWVHFKQRAEILLHFPTIAKICLSSTSRPEDWISQPSD